MAGDTGSSKDKDKEKDKHGRRKSSDKPSSDDKQKSSSGNTDGVSNVPGEFPVNAGASVSGHNSLVSLMTNPPSKRVEDPTSSLMKELKAENKATVDKLAVMIEAVKKLTEQNQNQSVQPVQFELQEADGEDYPLQNDEDDEDLDQYYGDEKENEEEDEDDGETHESGIVDKFGISKKREVPDPLQVVLWESGRRVTEEYGEDDWKKLAVKAVVKRYTEHPSAVMFAAPRADPQLPELQFQDRKERERHYIEIQNAQGAMGAIATKVLLKIQDESDKMANVIRDFEDGAVQIENPREEASQILKLLRKSMMDSWAKELSELTKTAGATFSRLMMMRRQQFEQVTGHFKGAKSQLKRLQPSREYLYGNKVGDLCKDLEVSSQLSPLALSRGRGGARGRGWFRGGRGGSGGQGGYRGGSTYRGGSGCRGAPSNRRGARTNRVDQFKEN